ncbi:MAG: DUF2267 domain-containing protein [Beijerinckiaceae bacterium]
MEELVGRVSAAAGIDADKAQTAIGMILAFLKKEAPGEATESLIAKLPGAEEAVANPGGGGGIMGAIGGMMGGGIMGLGTQLMGAGLSMGEIQSVSRELFAVGREKAGEDTMGEIVNAVPGLSQFI